MKKLNRVYNFAAGPSTMPLWVLDRIKSELLSYNGCGMSVMEMSHRSKVFGDIIETARQDIKDIMDIPDNYRVLFLQGGASTQFAMIPLNLFSKNKKADYINTGAWSKKAIAEAKKYGSVNVAASSEDDNFTYIPEFDEKRFDKDADYFCITANNTIFGTRYTKFPDTGDVPLIADMSSNIMSEVIDVSKFGMIFAGAQKNIGPAGVTIVIIRKDLIGKALDITPTMLNYKTHADKDSLFNTPPAFAIYVCGLMFKWIKSVGGVKEIEKNNIEKAKILYDYLDNSKMFKGTVRKKDRSLMNVPFVTGKEELDLKFTKEAEKNGMVALKGHRLVGGIRASIYNAMTMEGVKKLVEFMKKFEIENR